MIAEFEFQIHVENGPDHNSVNVKLLRSHKMVKHTQTTLRRLKAYIPALVGNGEGKVGFWLPMKHGTNRNFAKVKLSHMFWETPAEVN